MTRRGCGWLDPYRCALFSCDSICSVFTARKGHGGVLATSSLLGSEEMDKWNVPERERERMGTSVRRGTCSRKAIEEERTCERTEGQKGERAKGRGRKKACDSPVPILLCRKGFKLKKKKAKTQVLGIFWAHAFTALVTAVPRATSNVCLSKANPTPLLS